MLNKALLNLFKAITTTTRHRRRLERSAIDAGEMNRLWYDEFMNLVHITIRYSNCHAWAIERFKQIVNGFMDNLYNTIDADPVAHVPPLTLLLEIHI